METDVKQWLKSIHDNFPIVQIVQNLTPLDQVQKLLKIIVFSIHVSKKDLIAPITSSNWVEYIQNAIEHVSTSDNILFYSNQQMAVLNSNDPRYKLIICGPFGTGKTILLQQKAMQLNGEPRYKGKIMFLIEQNESISELKSMLYHRMRVELEMKHGIFVIQIKRWSQHEHILQNLMQHDIKAVFCDEFNMHQRDLIEKMKEMVDFLWIVPSTKNLSDHLSDHSLGLWRNEFTFLDLSQNFRNAREIVKSTISSAEENDYKYKQGIVMPPENFPTGCPPIFVDTFEEAMKEERKRTKYGILVILGIEEIYVYLNQMNEKWKRHSLSGNDFKGNENPYKFLLQEGNILIVDHNLTYGFEWQTVIMFEYGVNYTDATIHDCNLMM
ncbi:uncharacterized protein, partial [Clytia hemisphaerica]|uniref:uncharacterized protein n=1 Tax=Clytia hemisphaerica TaxID=252671 RepID=UPI0034D56646